VNGLKDRNSTIYAVAASANVSIGTVSNYLNRPELVSVKTRARISRAIKELNFRPHVGATMLSGKASRLIGLVLLDISNPFFTDVARGAETVGCECGHLTVLCNSGGDEAQELQYLQSLEAHHVAGVLLSPANEHSTAVLDVHKRGTRIVLMGRASDNYCCAMTDNVYGGALVGTHLVELGHKSITFVTGPLTATQYLHRLQGLRSALDQTGIPAAELSIHVVPGLGSIPEGREAVASLLSLPRRPTAIFCSNDLLAFGVYIGLIEAGLRVPEDMSLVG
jgi:LacI family transcriptional regulator